MQLADGREGRSSFVQNDAPIGHVVLLVEDEDGQLVVVVVFVFVVVGQVFVFLECLEQGHEIVLLRHVEVV